MTTIFDRYDEITALLSEEQEEYLEYQAHGAPPEIYIMLAAEALGFSEPALALDLEMPLEELIQAFT